MQQVGYHMSKHRLSKGPAVRVAESRLPKMKTALQLGMWRADVRKK